MTHHFPEMVRVENGHGSAIDPPLDDSWSHQRQLEWRCAVVRVDTGLEVSVRPGHSWLNGYELPDQFSLSGRTWARSADFWNCWTYLNGLEQGARMARGQK
jgi:hypothetical protein